MHRHLLSSTAYRHLRIAEARKETQAAQRNRKRDASSTVSCVETVAQRTSSAFCGHWVEGRQLARSHRAEALRAPRSQIRCLRSQPASIAVWTANPIALLPATHATAPKPDTRKPRKAFRRGRAARLWASAFHRCLSFELMFVSLRRYEPHPSRGRTVSRSAYHYANRGLPDIRSFVPASRSRSRHANTDSGNPRTLAMLLDSNRPHWMALPSGQAQCSRFGARLVPVSLVRGLASPCGGPADTCAERLARHANTEQATRAIPEAITCHGKPETP